MIIQKPIKILLVEDEPSAIEVTQLLLQQCGYHNITIANTAKQALENFFDLSFQIVIFNMRLPDMDGIELCLRMRNRLQGKPLPLIAFTADERQRQACLKAGADEFLPKPANPDVFKALLNRFIA